jgi:hypothetical protein
MESQAASVTSPHDRTTQADVANRLLNLSGVKPPLSVSQFS